MPDDPHAGADASAPNDAVPPQKRDAVDRQLDTLLTALYDASRLSVKAGPPAPERASEPSPGPSPEPQAEPVSAADSAKPRVPERNALLGTTHIRPPVRSFGGLPLIGGVLLIVAILVPFLPRLSIGPDGVRVSWSSSEPAATASSDQQAAAPPIGPNPTLRPQSEAPPVPLKTEATAASTQAPPAQEAASPPVEANPPQPPDIVPAATTPPIETPPQSPVQPVTASAPPIETAPPRAPEPAPPVAATTPPVETPPQPAAQPVTASVPPIETAPPRAPEPSPPVVVSAPPAQAAPAPSATATAREAAPTLAPAIAAAPTAAPAGSAARAAPVARGADVAQFLVQFGAFRHEEIAQKDCASYAKFAPTRLIRSAKSETDVWFLCRTEAPQSRDAAQAVIAAAATSGTHGILVPVRPGQ
jgi:hypothetical protein